MTAARWANAYASWISILEDAIDAEDRPLIRRARTKLRELERAANRGVSRG